MYDFNYRFVKKHCHAESLFTEPDSLTYEINQKLLMKNFLSTNTCLILVTIHKIDETNKKLISKTNDESEGKIINEFVGLRSKMYSLKNIDGKESNAAKGVYGRV